MIRKRRSAQSLVGSKDNVNSSDSSQKLNLGPVAEISERYIEPVVHTQLVASEATNVPISLEVTVKAELDFLNSNTSCNIWVATEVVGQVQPYTQNPQDAEPVTIAVIIDNSLSSSDDALDTAYQLAFNVSDLLVHDNDLLTILTTSPMRTNHRRAQQNELYPLNRCNMDAVREALRLVSEDRLPAPAWKEVILKTSRVLENEAEISPNRTRNVFILASTLVGCDCLEQIASFATIHYIQTGAVPSTTNNYSIKGWNIPLPSLESDTFLKDIVSVARQGTTATSVENVNIMLRPGQGCKVIKVYGQQIIERLEPGHRIIILTLLELTKHTTQLLTSTRTESFSRVDFMLEELGTMLGDVYQKVLDVSIAYEDASDTVRNSHKSCFLRRPDPSSQWSMASSESSLQSWPEDAELVIGRLVLCRSMSIKPEAAIELLDSIFTGSDSHSTTLMNQMQAIKRELIYRVRAPYVDERNMGIYLGDGDQSMQEPLGDENQTPSSSTLGSPRDGSPDSTLTVIHNRQVSTDSTDSARKIWLNMRKDSKTLLPESHDMQLLRAKQDQVVALRREALRNKRSIGADTLRSFSLSAVDGPGSAAPWL